MTGTADGDLDEVRAVEALPLDERASAYLAAHRALQQRLGVAPA